MSSRSTTTSPRAPAEASARRAACITWCRLFDAAVRSRSGHSRSYSRSRCIWWPGDRHRSFSRLRALRSRQAPAATGRPSTVTAKPPRSRMHTSSAMATSRSTYRLTGFRTRGADPGAPPRTSLRPRRSWTVSDVGTRKSSMAMVFCLRRSEGAAVWTMAVVVILPFARTLSLNTSASSMMKRRGADGTPRRRYGGRLSV